VSEEKTLDEHDVTEIVPEILLVQTKSEILGRILKLPKPTVDSIIYKYSDPQEQLIHVIDTFVNQVHPKPTWRAIVDALKNPLINLPHLAEEIKQRHCPHLEEGRHFPCSNLGRFGGNATHAMMITHMPFLHG
jgi:hypothetical protein